MYTSGWPKNQKMCCQRIASPPSAGSKMAPPRWRSMSSIPNAAVSGGNADQDEQGRHEDVPGEDRHPEHPHPWRPQAVDRRDQVDRGKDARDPDEDEADDPQIEADARFVGAGERDIPGPAARSGTACGEEAGQDDEPAEQEEPVRQRVESRERHVRCADLQWDDVVRKTRSHRRPEQQQHDGPVHREQLIKGLLIHDLQAG